VSKVKVRRKPNISHDDDYAGMMPSCLCGQPSSASTAKAIHCAFASLSYQRSDGFGKGIDDLQSGQRCNDRFG
jgi:hypothetical protein